MLVADYGGGRSKALIRDIPRHNPGSSESAPPVGATTDGSGRRHGAVPRPDPSSAVSREGPTRTTKPGSGDDPRDPAGDLVPDAPCLLGAPACTRGNHYQHGRNRPRVPDRSPECEHPRDWVAEGAVSSEPVSPRIWASARRLLNLRPASITVAPSAFSSNANALFAWPGPGTRNASFTEPRNPSLSPKGLDQPTGRGYDAAACSVNSDRRCLNVVDRFRWRSVGARCAPSLDGVDHDGPRLPNILAQLVDTGVHVINAGVNVADAGVRRARRSDGGRVQRSDR